ncbi:MAG: class I SAM-dependent methyltransferase [Actinomycetota bacterium]|nr:class I SAM-dependent methyltransferase [Actinomycetota bacterium]
MAGEVDPLTRTQLGELAREDTAMSAARSRAGLTPDLPSPPVGALLAWTSATLHARGVVEVGTCAGVTGLWLLRGMIPRGVLTTIDPDPQAQKLAARAYEEAGVTSRIRAILGDPLEVLPRLSDGGYDLLVLQSVGPDHPRYLEHALRLLRPGGVLLARQMTEGNPSDLRARREFVQLLTEDERFAAAVLPLDTGVAVATLLSR